VASSSPTGQDGGLSIGGAGGSGHRVTVKRRGSADDPAPVPGVDERREGAGAGGLPRTLGLAVRSSVSFAYHLDVHMLGSLLLLPVTERDRGSGPAYSRYFKQIAKAVELPRP
jgi:hypothetical protein